MGQPVWDFIKNTSLLGLLTLMTFAVIVIASLGTLLVGLHPARRLKHIRWGLFPLLVGIVTMGLGCFSSYKYLMGPPPPEWSLLIRRDAFIHGMIGLLGASIFLAATLIARERKNGSGGRYGGSNGV